MIPLSILILVVVCGVGCYFLSKIVVELKTMNKMMEPTIITQSTPFSYETTPPPIIKEEDIDGEVIHGRTLEIMEEEAGIESVEEKEYRVELNEMRGRARG